VVKASHTRISARRSASSGRTSCRTRAAATRGSDSGGSSEIAFWALLAAGLAARYLLRRRRFSTALLVAVPLVDLVLLTATVVDLGRGATAGSSHGPPPTSASPSRSAPA
jgi:hypothetical protein